MKEAVEKVKSGEMTAYRAHKIYGIPKQTLSDRLTGKVSIDARLGRPTVLTTSEENEIVAACIMFAEWGLNWSQIIALVSNVKIPFTKMFQARIGGEDF